MYGPGDIIFIQRATAASMVYYSEHRNEIQCPCHWKNQHAEVVKVRGNFIHCHKQFDPSSKSVFHYKDVRLIQRAGVEDA